MTRLNIIALATIICGGAMALSGCHHQETGMNRAPFPAPQAAPSAQVQIQQVENDPHIPAAQKPGIEASIARNNAPAAVPPHQTRQ